MHFLFIFCPSAPTPPTPRIFHVTGCSPTLRRWGISFHFHQWWIDLWGEVTVVHIVSPPFHFSSCFFRQYNAHNFRVDSSTSSVLQFWRLLCLPIFSFISSSVIFSFGHCGQQLANWSVTGGPSSLSSSFLLLYIHCTISFEILDRLCSIISSSGSYSSSFWTAPFFTSNIAFLWEISKQETSTTLACFLGRLFWFFF